MALMTDGQRSQAYKLERLDGIVGDIQKIADGLVEDVKQGRTVKGVQALKAAEELVKARVNLEKAIGRSRGPTSRGTAGDSPPPVIRQPGSQSHNGGKDVRSQAYD